MAAPAAEVLGVVDGDVVAPAQISLAERVHAMQRVGRAARVDEIALHVDDEESVARAAR